MKFHPSRFVLGAGIRFPSLTKPVLWIWGQYGARTGRFHWLFMELGNALNYRVPFWAKLASGNRMKVAINDTTGQEIVRLGCTEPDSELVMTKLIRPGDTFFDLGAHVGYYTLLASRLVGSRGRVHSFEPDRATFNWLRANIRANALKNVMANRAAVTEQSGNGTLYLGTIETIAANSLAKPKGFSGRVEEIPLISIDAYCRENDIKKIEFMKIDVEGAEIDVLRGAKTFLERRDKPILHIEFHPDTQKAFGRSLVELEAALRSYGYELYRITSKGVEPLQLQESEPRVFNVLAISVDGGDLLSLLQH